MKIIKFPLGRLQANCYFLIEGKMCLIIDPGDEAGFILEEIQRRKLNLVAILATHGHFDHVAAAGEIQLSFNVPLYICQKDLFLITRLNETAKHFLGYNSSVIKPKNIKYLHRGKFNILDFTFKILFSPGHTLGSCCFYFKKQAIVFTGDTLFKNGIGRYDFSYSSKEDLDKSLVKLLRLPETTIIYSGHGEETNIESEKTQLIN